MISAVALALSAALAAAPAAARPADLPACPSAEEKPDVAALVRRIEGLLEGASSVSTFTMTIKTKDWTRQLKLKSWSKGRDFSLVRVLEGGPRESGMMTLKREKQLWNYLPQAGRVMKLPSGMLGDSWMGSDFTNDDLVRGSSLVDDYASKVLGIEKAGAREVWKIELTPKADSAVVWGRVEMLVDRQSCLPVSQTFFDEEGKLARKLEYDDFRQVGWRQFPARMTFTPAEQNRSTSLVYDQIEFDLDIPDDTFGLHRLRQGR
jgi:outer membrane lipoprotein-sorting protein